MKTIQEIKQDFEQIFAEVSGISGMTTDSATEIAKVILQESGKNSRTQAMNEKSNSNAKRAYNSNVPATEKQKYLMKLRGINFQADVSKSEASRLIDNALGKKSEEKGRAPPAPLFPK